MADRAFTPGVVGAAVGFGHRPRSRKRGWFVWLVRDGAQVTDLFGPYASEVAARRDAPRIKDLWSASS